MSWLLTHPILTHPVVDFFPLLPLDRSPGVENETRDEEGVDVSETKLCVGHELAAGLGMVVDSVDLERERREERGESEEKYRGEIGERVRRNRGEIGEREKERGEIRDKKRGERGKSKGERGESHL